MTDQPNAAREAFDKWAEEKGYCCIKDHPHGPCTPTDNARAGWDAALSHQSSELREARERIAALESERESMLATKREQIDRLVTQGELHREQVKVLREACALVAHWPANNEHSDVCHRALSTADRIANEEGK